MRFPSGRVRLALIVFALGAMATAIPAVAGSAPAATGPGLLPDLQTVVPSPPADRQPAAARPAAVLQRHRQHRPGARSRSGPRPSATSRTGSRRSGTPTATSSASGSRASTSSILRTTTGTSATWRCSRSAGARPTGPVVSGNSIKVTFCLIDWYALEGNSPTKKRGFFDCETSYQGISAGWVDQYHHSLEGQRLDLTTAPNDTDLYLVSTSNFAHAFEETNPDNNTAWVRFRLSQESQGNRKLTVTGNSPCATPAMCGVGVPNR